MINRSVGRGLAGCLMTGALLVGVSATASQAATPIQSAPVSEASSPAPDGVCSGGWVYTTTKTSGPTFQQAAGASVSGDGGITLSLSRSKTYTVTGTISGSTSAEAGVIFAKASATVGASVALSHSSTITSGGTWTVPSNWAGGRLTAGSMKYGGGWKKFQELPNCSLVLNKSGTWNGPKLEWHFKTERLYY